MLSSASCRKRGWDVSHFSSATKSLLPGTPAASLQTRGRAQHPLSPMVSEPGWIPFGGASTGTGGVWDCLMPQVALPGRHCQGRGFQPGDRGDPKHIVSLPNTSIHSPVFPALPGHKETLPSLATVWRCLQPQGKGSTDF